MRESWSKAFFFRQDFRESVVGNDLRAFRTSAQIYGEGGMRADRAAMRNEVNAALAGAGGTEEHEGVALAEAVISGDVDFLAGRKTGDLLAQARAQIDQILRRSDGRPSTTREAVVEFRLNATGQLVTIPTGRSEAAFVRRREEMVIRFAARASFECDQTWSPPNTEFFRFRRGYARICRSSAHCGERQ